MRSYHTTASLGTTVSEETPENNAPVDAETKPDLSGLTTLGKFEAEDIAAIEKACMPKTEKEKKENINWPATVVEAKDSILAQAVKGILWTAGDIGGALVKVGSVNATQGWNVLGSSLGKSGLDLPCRKIGTKRYFLLACIGAAPEEKLAKQEQLNLLPSKAVAMLVARFDTVAAE